MYFTKMTRVLAAPALVLAFAMAGCSPGLQSGSIDSEFSGVKSATAISPTAVVLNWIKAPNYTNYDIYANYQHDKIATSIFATQTVENLTENTSYTFKVVASGSATSAGGAVEYAVSTWKRFTGVDSVYRDADGNLVVTWNYSNPVEEFEIFYSPDTAPTATSTSNWLTPNAVAPAGTAQYIFKGLRGSTTYFFTVHCRYRQGEYERTTKVLAQSTNSSFQAPTYDLPKITIGSLPTITVSPVITDQYPAQYYTSQAFRNGSSVSDPIHGAGKLTFSSTTNLPLGKIDGIELDVGFNNGTINETLKIPNLTTYLKGVVPFIDDPPIAQALGPAFEGKAMAVGDFNCDGFDDLAVGLPDASLAQFGVSNAGAGAVAIYYGGQSANGKYVLQTSPAPSLTPVNPGHDPQVITFPDLTLNANFGFSLAARGNLNGDKNGIYNCNDLAVGAPGQNDPNGNPSGNVFVFFGAANVGLKAPSTVSSFPQNSETCDGQTSGATCTAVRLWPNYNLWPQAAFGGAYVPTASSYNTGGRIKFGYSVAYVGDFNADGFEDLAIGAPNASWDGVVAGQETNAATGAWDGLSQQVGYVAMYFGSPFGLGYETPSTTSTSAQFRWVKIYPSMPQANMHFGSSIAGGDIDGRNRLYMPISGVNKYVGGGDMVVGAPDFCYSNPLGSSNVFPLTSAGADTNVGVTPADGGWYNGNSATSALSTNPYYGFTQPAANSCASYNQGIAFAYFGNSSASHLTTASTPTASARAGFWHCGKRGSNSNLTHFSCLAGSGDSRLIFPRDKWTNKFGNAVAIIGDKSARDQTDTLKCTPASYSGATSTPAATGPCRDANGDSFGEIVVGAYASSPGAVGASTPLHTNSGVLWEYFGNYNRLYESGTAASGSLSAVKDNFNVATADVPYLTEAGCPNFALSGLTTANDSFATVDKALCRPVRLVPNSIPDGAQMGQYQASFTVGDITRDGLGDLAVGAPQDNTRGASAGAVYAFTSLRGAGLTSNFKKFIRNATDVNDLFGYSAAIGDFDPPDVSQEHAYYGCDSMGNDTCGSPASRNMNAFPFKDVAVGAPFEDSNRPAGGGVHLFNSGTSVLPAIRTTSDVDIYDTLASLQSFGYGEARIVGDINGDGYDDAIAHIQSYSSSGQSTYDAVVYYGSSIGLVTTTFCLNNVSRIFKAGMGGAAECYPSNSHGVSITNNDIVLPQRLVRPNNVSARWGEIGYDAGDVNGDGFADVAFVDPCVTLGTNALCRAQVLVYYGTRGGLQDIVIPSWRPAANDPQIVTIGGITFPNATWDDSRNSRANRDSAYKYNEFVQHADFNGDGYSDLVFADPQAQGPSLTSTAGTTIQDPITGYIDPTEVIKRITSWPVGTASVETNVPAPETPFGTTSMRWQCAANSGLAYQCMAGNGPSNHGALYIYYGSQGGVATLAMYSGNQTADLNTPGLPANSINYVYNTAAYADLSPTSASNFCTSLSPTGGCVPAVQILRNPVFVNVQNGYITLGHFFGESMTPFKNAGNDTFDSLMVGAPGYQNIECQDPDPYTSQQYAQGRIYLYRGSKYGLIASAKTDYYPTPATSSTQTNCYALPDANDTGLGLEASNANRIVRAIRMNYSPLSTAAETAAINAAKQTSAFSYMSTQSYYGNPTDTRNSHNRSFGLRMVNVGDIDGDGNEDFVITAPYENVADQGGNVVLEAGAGYVFYGPICASDNDTKIQNDIQDPTRVNTQVTMTAAVARQGTTLQQGCVHALAPQKFIIKDITPLVTGDTGSTGYAYGLSVIGNRKSRGIYKGDINLDKFSDVIMASPFWNDTVNNASGIGRGVILFGSGSGLYTNDYPSAVVEPLTGGRTKPYILSPPIRQNQQQFFRGNVSTGDVNGDSSIDLMVPSFYYDGTGTISGIDLGTFFLFY